MQIRDIAKKLRIAPSTVSRALNPAKEHLISAKVREKIKSYVEKVKFIPNRAARELTTGRSHTIGVILPTTFNSFFFRDHMAKVMAGVYSTLEKDRRFNCKILIYPKGQASAELEKQVRDGRIDGLLLSSLSDHAFSSSRFFPKNLSKQWKKPVVVLGIDMSAHPSHGSVYSSNVEAAREAVKFLIQKGHRRIAMIKPAAQLPDIEERHEGYLAALKDHNIKLDPTLVMAGVFLKDDRVREKGLMRSVDDVSFDALESGYESALALMKKSGDKPTAIFCANDEMAIGTLRALKSLGIRCPKDVAVMGFDGIDGGEFTEPRLSSVSQNAEQMAEQGTQMLLDLIEGRLKEPQDIQLPMKLVIRDSV